MSPNVAPMVWSTAPLGGGGGAANSEDHCSCTPLLENPGSTHEDKLIGKALGSLKLPGLEGIPIIVYSQAPLNLKI